MIQRIEHAYPPLIDKIDAVFNVRKLQGVIYSWGDVIFAPDGGRVVPALRAHEAVHGDRQMVYVDPVDGERGITAWWLRYLADKKFRLDEEIPAHCAEYQWHVAQPDGRLDGWRSKHQYHKHHIAIRLSGPLYGRLISLGEAKRLISE